MNLKLLHNRKGPVVLVSRPIAYTFPLSYAYLAAYLLQQGEDVRILFRQHDLKELVRQIMQLNPVLVGFGNLYPELLEIRHLIILLDQAERRFPIVIGGQMVSPIPQFAVRVTGADFGVVGEGEIILYQLVCALRQGKDPSDILGLAVRQENQVVFNGPGPFIEDLSQLPPVPYELFAKSEWLQLGRYYTMNVPQPHWHYKDRVINVHGGRGCPFRCNFCYHHSRTRYRPISLMLAEAQETLEHFDGNMLYFSDDLVLGTPKRARELVSELRTFRRPVEYSVSARFDILNNIDDNLLAEMKATGCRIMGLGIESGSDRILKTIGKNCTATQILYNLSRLKRIEIIPTVSIMVGQFEETRDDAEASIKLMLESVRENPNIQYAFTVTTPFPGSPLYNYIMQNGLLKGDEEFYERYFSGCSTWNMVVNISKMTDGEVWNMHKKMTILYSREREKALGRAIGIVSTTRKWMNRFDRIIGRRLLSLLPEEGRMGIASKICRSSRDMIYHRLEKVDLKLRGLSE